MSETVWIKLTSGATEGKPLPWARLDDTGRVLARGVDLPEALPAGLNYKAVVAADKIFWTRLIPPGRRRLAGPTLAYALEDRLADSPETVHAVMGSVAKDGTATVAVVDQIWFAETLALLDQTGISPLSVMAEQALLPCSATEWHLVWGDEALLRLADGLCLCLSPDPASARQLLQLAMAREEGAPDQLVIHAESGRVLPEASELTQGMALPTVTGQDYDWAIAAQTAGRPDVELLQGRFALRGQGGIDWRSWRPVALLAAVLVAVNIAGLSIDTGLKVWKARQIDQANRRLLLQTFPETKVIVDPVVQMRRQVAILSHKSGAPTSIDFLPMLARAGAALPASTRTGARQIQYRQGRLTLMLPVGQAGAVDWGRAGFRASRQLSPDQKTEELMLEVGP